MHGYFWMYNICWQPTSKDNESTTHTSWGSFSMQTQWKENGMFATAVADSPVELVVALMGATGLPESTSWSMSAVGLPCWTTELVLALASMPGLAATVWTTFVSPTHTKLLTTSFANNPHRQTKNLRHTPLGGVLASTCNDWPTHRQSSCLRWHRCRAWAQHSERRSPRLYI